MPVVRLALGLLFAAALLFTAAESRCAEPHVVTLEASRTSKIVQQDQRLFLWMNSFHSPFWDRVMHAISGKMIWVPLFLAIFIFLGIKYKRKFLVIFLLILFGFALTELSAVYLFKNTFQRLRPCHEPALEGLVHVYGKSSSLYGFVSSHAANCFYLAVACGLFVRKRWFLACLLCWAAIISYSRIYLGMHYPGDVIGGAALGALMGGSMVKLYEIYRSRFEIPVPGAGCRAFKPDNGDPRLATRGGRGG